MNALSSISSTRQWEVLGLLREETGLTRAAIGQRTGLSASQVSRLTADLITAGLVEVRPLPGEGFGRPPEALRLSGAGPWVVGMEVGAGRQRAVLVNLRGEVVRAVEAPLAEVRTGREAVEGFVAQVRGLARAAGVPTEAIAAVGLALYAAVDPIAGRVVEWSEQPGWLTLWRDVDLRAELGARLGIGRVVIDDAVRMRAVAEVRDDEAARQADSLYVLADTGIGASLVRQGRPDIGSNRLAGDIGHVVVEEGGAPCACGQRGCLEAVASTRAVEREAAGLRGGPVPIARVIDGADRGDADLARLLARAGERLAEVLAPVVCMLSPAALVVSGRLSASETYMAALADRLGRRVHPRLRDSLEVSRARLGEEGGQVGAALVALDALFGARPEPAGGSGGNGAGNGNGTGDGAADDGWPAGGWRVIGRSG